MDGVEANGQWAEQGEFRQGAAERNQMPTSSQARLDQVCSRSRRYFRIGFARVRAGLGSESRSQKRIGIGPVTRTRNAGDGWALETQLAAGAIEFEHQNLTPRYDSAAAFATPLIIERMPVMEFVEITQKVELVVRQEMQR